MKRKNGFTLIELIAVLVILAILALIVTPLVMNIIRKARISADKHSIDAYGRSVELAIASYLLDNGDFPTDISQLSIEYSGDQVECATTQLNSDSSVYLAGCTVGGRSVDYTYGNDKSPTYTAYTVGDEVVYNGVNYYVIKDSGIKESIVTLLKAEPLTTDEVNQYGTGHINKYTFGSVGTAYDGNGYGGVAYYSSETCGYVNGSRVGSGCTCDYASSDIKYIVDAWASNQLHSSDLIEDETGNKARLLKYDEFNYIQLLGERSDNWWRVGEYWLFGENEQVYRVNCAAYVISDSSYKYEGNCNSSGIGVRPVITLNKSALN